MAKINYAVVTEITTLDGTITTGNLYQVDINTTGDYAIIPIVNNNRSVTVQVSSGGNVEVYGTAESSEVTASFVQILDDDNTNPFATGNNIRNTTLKYTMLKFVLVSGVAKISILQ